MQAESSAVFGHKIVHLFVENQGAGEVMPSAQFAISLRTMLTELALDLQVSGLQLALALRQPITKSGLGSTPRPVEFYSWRWIW